MTSHRNAPLDRDLVRLLAQAQRISGDGVSEADLRLMLSARAGFDEGAFRAALAEAETDGRVEQRPAPDGQPMWWATAPRPGAGLDDVVTEYLIRLTMDDLALSSAATTQEEFDTAVSRAVSRLQSAASEEPDAVQAALFVVGLLQEHDHPLWVRFGVVAFAHSEPDDAARIGLQVAEAIVEDDPATAADIWAEIATLGVAGYSGYAGYRRGCWLAEHGRLAEAADTLGEALDLADEPTADLVSYELGRVLLRAGDADGAVAALHKAARSNDVEHATAARQLRGVAAAKAGDAEAAMADLLPLVEAGLRADAKPEPDAEHALIVVLSTAPDQVRQVVDKSPELVAAYLVNRLASALAINGRIDEAQQVCEQAIASGRLLLMDRVGRVYAQLLRSYRDVPSIPDAVTLLTLEASHG
jgi:predicted negative regulator of RcsB-dependent stress response